MTESVVCFSKHDILNVLAVHLIMYISSKMYHIKCLIQICLLGLNIGLLYNNFGVLSFHSVLCFPNDYHMVMEEKWNINDLKSINCNKVNYIFFH